jgi:outer membrane protein assembly factor BamA
MAAESTAAAQAPPDRPRPSDVPADEARGLVNEPGTQPEDVALFAPRAVLFVPSIVLGAVFWPIQKGLRAVERHHVVERLEDFFYNDARTAAILPAVSFGSGFGLQVGVSAFHDDLGGHGEHGEVEALWGPNGQHVYLLSFEAERAGGSPLWIETKTAFERHPSLRFYGLGSGDGRALGGVDLHPRAGEAEVDYEHRRLRIINTAGVTIGEPDLELKLGGRARFKRHDFDRSPPGARDLPALEDVYDTSRVPGYDHGATVLETEGLAIFDARDARGATGNGLYAEAFAGGALPLRDYEYARFGGEVTGYVDLWHGDRVLVVRAAMEAVEGEPSEIPFVELPYLGGPNRLRGYPLYRFRDEKAVFGTIEYHYPIHELLAGSLYVDAGQVAPSFAGLVEHPDVHVGFGGGIVVRSEDHVYFTIDVAGGDGVQVYATTDPLRAFADRDDEL